VVLRQLLAQATPQGGKEMSLTALILRWLFTKPPEQLADPHCTYCKGLGYDASGYTCTCVKEKK
jgi:hypothetical protein